MSKWSLVAAVCQTAMAIEINRRYLVPQKRDDIGRLEFLPAVQKFELDQKNRHYKLTADFFDQGCGRGGGPTGREEVVDEDDLLAGDDGVDMEFHFGFAVFERILGALGFV